MKLHKLFLTNNDCYKTGKKQTVRKIMMHSTGANNPYLSRYVGPDDGILGHNKHGNHWNQPKPDGRNVCVHAFIGYTKDKKEVATYQTLPWDHVGWHSGKGSRGSANTLGYTSFEICEGVLTDKVYFNQIYKEAVGLCVHLCKLYNLKASDIIDHSEGHQLGIASNHGDVRHWFRLHGKTMDIFRADVTQELNKKEVVVVEDKRHWADKHFESLNAKGITVSEKRYEDYMKRGEVLAMIDRATDYMKGRDADEK